MPRRRRRRIEIQSPGIIRGILSVPKTGLRQAGRVVRTWSKERTKRIEARQAGRSDRTAAKAAGGKWSAESTAARWAGIGSLGQSAAVAAGAIAGNPVSMPAQMPAPSSAGAGGLDTTTILIGAAIVGVLLLSGGKK